MCAKCEHGRIEQHSDLLQIVALGCLATSGHQLDRDLEMRLIGRNYEISSSDVRFTGHLVNKKVHSNYTKWGG